MANRIYTNSSRAHFSNGSALVISLIVMAILLTLSLGVSDLLIGALRDNRALFEKTQAWYAAESGLEHALKEGVDNEAGFETERTAYLGGDSKNPSYSFKIKATAKTIPEKEPYQIKTPEDTYALLSLNESVTIPLFHGSKPEDAVNAFRVEFFIPPSLQGGSGRLIEQLDILRWKIFGIATGGAYKGEMEVINEFSPMRTGRNSAYNPTCMGTDSDCWNAVKKAYQRVFADDGSGGAGIEIHIRENEAISTFLQEHTQNFLVLTNIVNIDLIQGSLTTEERKSIANIRYRVVPAKEGVAAPTSGGFGNVYTTPSFTLPTMKLTADGTAGTTKQSIDVDLKRETFLPVFNYALYRTVEN